MTRNTLRNVLWALLALGLCVVIALYTVMHDSSVVDNMGSVSSAAGIRYSIESPVYLYFQDKNQAVLKPEERLMAHPEDAVEFARTIVEWLIKGPRHELAPTLPPETLLRTLFINEQTAYVDFSREMCDNHPGGVQTENLTIVSIANSLILNIPDIKRVKILIEGRECETLAGHIDIRNPFPANMLLVR